MYEACQESIKERIELKIIICKSSTTRKSVDGSEYDQIKCSLTIARKPSKAKVGISLSRAYLRV